MLREPQKVTSQNHFLLFNKNIFFCENHGGVTDLILPRCFSQMHFGGNLHVFHLPHFQLNYNERETGGPCVSVYFQDVKTPLSLPVEKCIEAALNALKSSGTESYYR